jgi:hypothetical protein
VAATVATSMSGYSWNTTKNPRVRHVHGEKDPNTIDLQLKMQKKPSATHNGTATIHNNGVDVKDRNKPVKPRDGRVSAEEKSTAGDHTQGEEKP